MIKRLLFLSTITFQLTNLLGQDVETQLRANAVQIVYLDTLEKPIYDKLKDFKLVMIGEMHGTNEPANFLIGLTELFANNGDTIQVGFEIPSEKMTDSSIMQSAYFMNNLTDGRSSFSWANAITRLSKNSRVQIFFFDINKTDTKNYQDRDSLMYLKIKKRIEEHPNWKTVTLSGNIHNMRNQIIELPTTAYYLCNDKDLNLSDKICTINHYFLRGTMLNNIGNGLELRQVDNKSSVYSETLNFDNYFYLYPTAKNYNGIIFTKTVTASELTNKK